MAQYISQGMNSQHLNTIYPFFQRFFSIQIRVRVFVVYSSSIAHFIQYCCVYYQGRHLFTISMSYKIFSIVIQPIFSTMELHGTFQIYIYIYLVHIVHTHTKHSQKDILKSYQPPTDTNAPPTHTRNTKCSTNFYQNKKKDRIYEVFRLTRRCYIVFSPIDIFSPSLSRIK